MAIGTRQPAQPEMALYFNSPTILPQQKKPIPLVSSKDVVDVVVLEGPASASSEKGNKRKMRSSPFLASAGSFFQAARSLSSTSNATTTVATAALPRPASSPKADDTTGVRDGDTSPVSSPQITSQGDNSTEMATVKVISRAVRQRVAQSSSAATSNLTTAGAASPVDTTASARSVEVECTSSSPSSTPVPPTLSSSSSKSPFKKRRRVVKATSQPSPLRNQPITPSDLPLLLATAATASTPSPKKKSTTKARKPTVWEKRTLVQKVLLKEFERTPHGAEILRRGARPGIAFLEEQKQILTTAVGDRKKDENTNTMVVKSKSKDVSAMRHWGRIVKTALAGRSRRWPAPWQAMLGLRCP